MSLNPLSWSAYDKTVYGGLALAGLGAYVGLKHGPKDEDPSERIGAGLWGVGAAAGVGLTGYAALSMVGFKNSGRFAWNRATSYASSIQKEASNAKSIFGKVSAYSRIPVVGGLGAIIGASVAGEDHRMRGAAIGAGVGAAASVAIRSANRVSKVANVLKKTHMTGPAKAVGIAGLISLAFGAGEMMNPSHSPAAAAIPDETTGEMQYADPSEASHYRTGAGRRSRNVGATGDVVFGSHNRRHG